MFTQQPGAWPMPGKSVCGTCWPVHTTSQKLGCCGPSLLIGQPRADHIRAGSAHHFCFFAAKMGPYSVCMRAASMLGVYIFMKRRLGQAQSQRRQQIVLKNRFEKKRMICHFQIYFRGFSIAPDFHMFNL